MNTFLCSFLCCFFLFFVFVLLLLSVEQHFLRNIIKIRNYVCRYAARKGNCCNWFCHLFSLLCYLKHFLMPNNDRHKSILFIAWKLNETFKHKCNLNFTFFSIFSSHFLFFLLVPLFFFLLFSSSSSSCVSLLHITYILYSILCCWLLLKSLSKL